MRRRMLGCQACISSPRNARRRQSSCATHHSSRLPFAKAGVVLLFVLFFRPAGLLGRAQVQKV